MGQCIASLAHGPPSIAAITAIAITATTATTRRTVTTRYVQLDNVCLAPLKTPHFTMHRTAPPLHFTTHTTCTIHIADTSHHHPPCPNCDHTAELCKAFEPEQDRIQSYQRPGFGRTEASSSLLTRRR